MIELHDLTIAFGKDKGIEFIFAIDVTDISKECNLYGRRVTLTVAGYSSTCLNKILMISGLTTILRLLLSSISFVSTKTNRRSIILMHSCGRVVFSSIIIN